MLRRLRGSLHGRHFYSSPRLRSGCREFNNGCGWNGRGSGNRRGRGHFGGSAADLTDHPQPRDNAREINPAYVLFLNLPEQLLDDVVRLEHDVHLPGVHRDLTAAELVQHILKDVRKFRHLLKAQKRGGSLDRVDRPENGVEQVAAGIPFFEQHQILAETVQNLPRLHDEALEDLRHFVVKHRSRTPGVPCRITHCPPCSIA